MFIPPGCAPLHTLGDVSVCVLRKASSNVQRKELEQRVIFELGTLHPGGMNVDFFRVHSELILALKKVPSYRKLGREKLLSIVYDLFDSI